MRTQKPQQRGRLALACIVATSLPAACSKDPGPEKVANLTKTVQAPDHFPDREPVGPIRHPDRDAPAARSGDQLADEELETTLAAAAKAMEQENHLEVMQTLRKCLNKTTPSARCEGRYAMAATKTGKHRAEVKYYLDQATQTDDPKADVDFWRQVGKTAQLVAQFDAAERAFGRITSGEGATADDYAALANAQQALDKRNEAVNNLEAAYKADPKRHELLFDRAVLVAQLKDDKGALALFKDYYAKTKGQNATRDEAVLKRIGELGGTP